MSQAQQKTKELSTNYQKQKMDFLDSLQPDDFRKGASFNQSEIIIDQLNKAIQRMVSNKENPEIFIKKAVANLFREDSSVAKKAIDFLEGLGKDGGVE